VGGAPGGHDWGPSDDEELPPYPGARYCGKCGIYDCECPAYEFSTDYEEDRELNGDPLWDDGCA
jgi:hypothetical protein